ncbi:MAG: dihydrofolate reductase family protein [Candidatus Komeilibacteria bacterium]|nr:dihydrofolate reductase family protein [Candidatus Komeilibacteria bacterium]
MRVVLYMAISANGMIAKKDDNTSWISATEWNSYSSMVRGAGCLIVGKRTYHILTAQPEFSEFKDVKLVVVSNNDFPILSPNHQVADSPKKALELLEDFDTAIVAGGGILNASFLKEELVDEVYLDIEPVILGNGIKLFNGDDFEVKLELLETKQLSSNELQLHYKIVK